MDDRPKWGVNRPPHQYVKASDRDQFSLRQRRRRFGHSKRSLTDSAAGADDIGSFLVVQPDEVLSDCAAVVAEPTSRTPLMPVLMPSASCSNVFQPRRHTGFRRGRRSRSSSPDTSVIVAPSVLDVPSKAHRRSTAHDERYSRSLPPQGHRVSRNVCTEIVPIRTDRNGQIYVNYAASAMLVSERPSAVPTKRHHYQHARRQRRMMERRTMDDSLELSGNGRSEPKRDVDQDTY